MSIASRSSIALIAALVMAGLTASASALPLFAPRGTLALPQKSSSNVAPFAAVPVSLFDQYLQGTVDFAARIALNLRDTRQ